MYRYAERFKNGFADFLGNYQYKKNYSVHDIDYDDGDELELFSTFLDDCHYPFDDELKKKILIKKESSHSPLSINEMANEYVKYYYESIIFNAIPNRDVEMNNLSFVKVFLFLYDALCTLYESCEIDSEVFNKLIGESLNDLLFSYNTIYFKNLDSLDGVDKDRVNLVVNYLFSALTAISIINHDEDKKFRKKMFSGNNNYKLIGIDCGVLDNINYEKEFNKFIHSYEIKIPINSDEKTNSSLKK